MKGKVRILLSLVIVSFFLVLAVGSGGSDNEVERVDVEEPVTAQDEPQEIDIDIEFLEESVLIILEENFEGFAEVEFVKEEETFYLTPTDPAIISELMDAIDGQAYAVEGWEGLVESQIGLSESIKELLPGYWISLRNPANPELSLLVVSDGIVLYDFLKDE